MAINPETQYPGRVAPASADYPYGAARNSTTPGDGTNTPRDAALVNDLFGFQQALLSEAGLVPSGTPDKVGASQYLDAINAGLAKLEFGVIRLDAFPVSPYEVAQVGDTCPAGTTALRGAGGTYSLAPAPVSGEITALDFTAGTATIGGVAVVVVKATPDFTGTDAAYVTQWGDAKTSTVNRMIEAGVKRIIMPLAMEADETIKPAQGVFLDTGNGWCTITNNIPGGDPFVKWDSNTDGGILRWFRWGNLLINNGTATGAIFDLIGIQHCKFGEFWTINSKGGTISFAYFNTFDKIQLQNLKEPLLFTGVSQSTDCNFNYIGKVTINNWVGEGLVIENSRGNTILQFDAETSIAMTGAALHLQDSSYNKVEHFWSEVLSTATAPTILIDAVISQSNNKKNIIEHVPQIITPGTGIEVSDSVDTKIGEARFVGCAVGIDDAGGNGGLVIYEPQFDTCTQEIKYSSNDTLVQRKPNEVEGLVNVNYTVNSINGGFGGYEYKVGGNLRWKVTCKTGNDVDINTVHGLAAQWIDNPAATRSQYSLRTGLNFGVAVTGADVHPNSLFRDSADQKLKYKDASSVIHLLY